MGFYTFFCLRLEKKNFQITAFNKINYFLVSPDDELALLISLLEVEIDIKQQNV